MGAEAAAFAIVQVEEVVRAVAGQFLGLDHCVVGAEGPAVVAGQAIAAAQAALCLGEGGGAARGLSG